jgi:hypothetical protein
LKNPALGRISLLKAVESMVFVFVFILVFISTTGMRAVVIAPQIVADGASRCPAQACADGRTGRAAQAVANDRTTRRAQTTTDRGFGAIAFLRAHRTTGCAAHTGPNRGPGAATHLSTHNVAQRTAQTTAYCRRTVTSRQCRLREEQSKNKRGQRHTSSTQACNCIAFGFRVHGMPLVLQGYARLEAMRRKTFKKQKARQLARLF